MTAALITAAVVLYLAVITGLAVVVGRMFARPVLCDCGHEAREHRTDFADGYQMCVTQNGFCPCMQLIAATTPTT